MTAVIDRINHDCFQITGENMVIYTDPYKIPDDLKKADIILVSHEHGDHCSPEDIAKIQKDSTVIIAPATCKDKFEGEVRVIKVGDTIEVSKIKIEAVHAYNLNKFRSPGVPFHPKSDDYVGYVFELDDQRIYFAGDTDNIPEMAHLGDIDYALLPVSGTYVMTAEEAADAASVIQPKTAIPMHYGAIVGDTNDAEKFKKLCECNVTII